MALEVYIINDCFLMEVNISFQYFHTTIAAQSTSVFTDPIHSSPQLSDFFKHLRIHSIILRTEKNFCENILVLLTWLFSFCHGVIERCHYVASIVCNLQVWGFTFDRYECNFQSGWKGWMNMFLCSVNCFM